MSWITQNKFLAGFGVAMIVGVGALGYLTYSAMGRSSSSDTEYHDALEELKRLQGGHPYPEKANRDKIIAQKAAYQEKISAFQKHLSDTVIPVEPLSPTEFQDKLKETVARITTKAGDAYLKLGPEKTAEKFYMGFPEYASKSPEKALVPQLSRELLAFESIINLMLAAKDVELIELKRDESKPANAPAANAKAERKLVH
ncbi:MAG: Amuc_1100 family pilus-like protein, partial [Verrucomicrobiota bacterium]